jgi:hypothetical protein
MKTKIVFASATALGLLMATGAYADNNQAQVKQTGDHNTAIGQQDGAGNYLGLANPSSGWGHVEQNGDYNNLDVQQTGNNNRVANSASDANVYQNGDRNSIDVTQTTSSGSYTSNSVLKITQTSNHGSAVTNKLVIQQDDGASGTTLSQQTVGSVSQDTNGYDINNSIYTNSIDILQRGSGYGYNKGNAVGSTSQKGYGNRQDVDQVGTSNYIKTITQTGNSNTATINLNGDQNALYKLEQTGSNDTATIKLSGVQNGTGSAGFITPNGSSPFTVYANDGTHVQMGVFTAGGPAAGVAQVTQGEVHQTGGNGNTASYIVTNSNYNLYGITQNGSGNAVVGTVSSDSNQSAVWQNGDGNVTDFIQEVGAGNNLGAASDGSNNLLYLRQSGAGNKLTASLQGNENNNTALSGNTFSGDALTIRNKVRAAANGGGFTQGDLWQYGDLNTMTVTVTASSDNTFGMFQGGSNNVLSHTISGGNFNQAVVAQLGSGNNSVTVQNGSYNNVGIKQ